MLAGRLLRYTFRGLLSVYSRYNLHAHQVAFATLSTGGFSRFVTFTTAPIVTGRDSHPLSTSVFHGAQHSSTRAGCANRYRCNPLERNYDKMQ